MTFFFAKSDMDALIKYTSCIIVATIPYIYCDQRTTLLSKELRISIIIPPKHSQIKISTITDSNQEYSRNKQHNSYCSKTKKKKKMPFPILLTSSKFEYVIIRICFENYITYTLKK